MEPTVRLFRTLANRARLRILRLLVVFKECRVSELIGATELGATTVSMHLRALSVCGIIWKRRSAEAVYYRIADAPANPLAQVALSLLKRTFRRVGERDPRLVAVCDEPPPPQQSDAILFSWFTSFTHPRRLQIIRHLSRFGASPQEDLVNELRMSPAAVCRHMSKLARRGMVRKVGPQRMAKYELALDGSSDHSSLLQAVVNSLDSPED
jgi:DNA-binding transcriptional ArsR family regulator